MYLQFPAFWGKEYRRNGKDFDFIGFPFLWHPMRWNSELFHSQSGITIVKNHPIKS